MRLYQTYKFRKQRKHLMKRLKENISDSEKYKYYLNKMTKLYKSYKKYEEEVIVQKMNSYLKLYGLKISGFYIDEHREELLEQVTQSIKQDFKLLMNAFKKLDSQTNTKLSMFNKMLSASSVSNKKVKAKVSSG